MRKCANAEHTFVIVCKNAQNIESQSTKKNHPLKEWLTINIFQKIKL
jgi:hypothetical protein